MMIRCAACHSFVVFAEGGMKKNYIISFLVQVGLPVLVSRTLPRETCLSRTATWYQRLQFDFGNLYAVPELVIQVSIRAGF